MSEKKLNEMHVSRCNVNLEDDCKQWYVTKAKSMGMSMSNLLSFVCTNYYETQRNAETLRRVSEMNQSSDIKELSDNVRELLSILLSTAEDGETQNADK